MFYFRKLNQVFTFGSDGVRTLVRTCRNIAEAAKLVWRLNGGK